jgi:hypothetical protein
MNKKNAIANRKCSALLATGVGAAVCLTGGTQAHAVNGTIAASNGGNSVFGNSTIYLFGNKATATVFFGTIVRLGAGSLSFVRTGGANISNMSASVTVNSLLPAASIAVLSNTTNKYYGMSFNDSGTKYGWVEVISYASNTLTLNAWSYNGSGGTIKTLSDSVTTGRLALADGAEKLHWSNDNEDGVARYEVQSQDDSGNWTASNSDVPGSGSYTAKVDSGKTCRLVVEMTDGSTKEIDF